MVLQAAVAPRDHHGVTCTIKYLPCKKNPVADALSRIKIDAVELGIDYENLAHEQAADPETLAYRTAIMSLKWKDVPLGPGGPTLLSNVSTGLSRPPVPTSHRRLVFDTIHGLSHSSSRTTARLLAENFVWHCMQKDATTWARQCIQCQASKVGQHTELGVGNFPQPGRHFGHIYVDTVPEGVPHGSLHLQELEVPAALCPPQAEDRLHSQRRPVRSRKGLQETLIVQGTHHRGPGATSQRRGSNRVGKLAPCQWTYTERTSPFMPPGLSSAFHVFDRDNAMRPPLTRSYRGPFLVLERNKKAFRVAIHRKEDWISIDHLKPAFLEEDVGVFPKAPHRRWRPHSPPHPQENLVGVPRRPRVRAGGQPNTPHPQGTDEDKHPH
ncbi:uncharacterized protein [Macrobrachium rosenbergii]|uniref:uncharacterized protein n=1 Tax=Macrobrachium rosenbergii TaxID=79674 RepID=UPI0034D771AF